MAQEGLQRAIGPLQHHPSQGTIASLTAGWTKHPLGQLIGNQCLFINLVRLKPACVQEIYTDLVSTPSPNLDLHQDLKLIYCQKHDSLKVPEWLYD